MITTSEMGGFFAAHAACILAEGESLIPMLAHISGDDRKMTPLELKTPTQAIEEGRKRLEANAMGAEDAVLIYEGVLKADRAKQDAILVEMRAYASPRSKAIVAVPYTPRASGAFRIHKPRLVLWEKCHAFNVDAMFASFLQGAGRHPQGRQVWNAALDETR